MDASVAHAQKLDQNYRFQRHIYDLTRRYYLFGRDRLLRDLAPKHGERILEIGCGTARNLRILARRHPEARLFGLDASRLMLATAQEQIGRSPEIADRITLRCALAEQFDARADFGSSEPFDAVFFSYALTMIPPWQAALDNAWRNLRPGGRLLAVDFWDGAGMPGWCRSLLRNWLARFHTHPQDGMPETVMSLTAPGEARLAPIGPRYAFLVECRKPL